ncbi:hypothetical protein, partial [Burkholderia contaminans]|uniref:hypothetical protein n=1 Tax=Burkholderia contaminans TaxID=488447 RepID=UPI001AA18CE8
TREVRPEYERNSPRMSSNSYVNLKIATCLVRYADDRLIDQRFLSTGSFWREEHDVPGNCVSRPSCSLQNIEQSSGMTHEVLTAAESN